MALKERLRVSTPAVWWSGHACSVLCVWCRNGSRLAGAYSEAETRKATIKLLRWACHQGHPLSGPSHMECVPCVQDHCGADTDTEATSGRCYHDDEAPLL